MNFFLSVSPIPATPAAAATAAATAAAGTHGERADEDVCNSLDFFNMCHWNCSAQKVVGHKSLLTLSESVWLFSEAVTSVIICAAVLPSLLFLLVLIVVYKGKNTYYYSINSYQCVLLIPTSCFSFFCTYNIQKTNKQTQQQNHTVANYLMFIYLYCLFYLPGCSHSKNTGNHAEEVCDDNFSCFFTSSWCTAQIMQQTWSKHGYQSVGLYCKFSRISFLHLHLQ